MNDISNRVAAELRENRKIEAIKLLREETGMSLFEAKAAVEKFRENKLEGEVNQISSTVNNTEELKPYTKVQTLLGLGVFLSFMWMFINIFILIASILILLNQDGYEKGNFIVTGFNYTNDKEDGLHWSLKGNVDGIPVRLADHSLLKAKDISAIQVRREFPTGTQIAVLYNPNVSDTLFQNRSINIIPYTSDMTSSEGKKIVDWVKRCFFPFFCFSLLLFMYNQSKNVRTI